MATPNIDYFDQITALVFADLYEYFPVPRVLSSEYYGSQIKWCDNNGDARDEFVFSSLKWLAEAGFLSYRRDLFPHYLENAVLTAKGLEVLKAIPESISTEKTIGERLMDGVKEGTTETLKESVRYVLAKGATLALGAFGLSS